MNSLQDILHFISKYVNFVNSYLKEYLIKRNFIVVFWKTLKIRESTRSTKIYNKKMEISI